MMMKSLVRLIHQNTHFSVTIFLPRLPLPFSSLLLCLQKPLLRLKQLLIPRQLLRLMLIQRLTRTISTTYTMDTTPTTATPILPTAKPTTPTLMPSLATTATTTMERDLLMLRLLPQLRLRLLQLLMLTLRLILTTSTT